MVEIAIGGYDVIGADEAAGTGEYMKSGWISHLTRIVKVTAQDRLSNAVLFTALFAISFAYTISQHMTASQPEPFPKYVVPLVIIMLELFASVVLVFMCWGRVRRFRRQRGPCYRIVRCKITVVGIVWFYVAVPIFYGLRLDAEWRCNDAWVACRSGVVHLEQVTDLLYPAVNVVYLGMLLIVCATFDGFPSSRSPVLTGLAVIQAATLSSWLDALIDESGAFSEESDGIDWKHELSRCFNRTRHVNISEHFFQCYSRSTPAHQRLEWASPYLYPWIMEYLMLVMEQVANWFFSTRQDSNAQVALNDPEQPETTINPTTSSSSASRSTAATSSTGDNQPGTSGVHTATTEFNTQTTDPKQLEDQTQSEPAASRPTSSSQVAPEPRDDPGERAPLLEPGVDRPQADNTDSVGDAHAAPVTCCR